MEKILINDLSFAYPDEPNRLIIKDINLEIEQGEFVCLLGQSGCGKSTLLKLLAGLQKPSQGEITIDGQPIDNISLENWRSQIGFVSQDSAIMAGTIRENLTYGLEGDYTDEDLWQVLDLAFARSFVENMPDQLNTEVGERGVKISGGQRQRLAIARAFL